MKSILSISFVLKPLFLFLLTINADLLVNNQNLNVDLPLEAYSITFYANHPNTGGGTENEFSLGHVWIGFNSPKGQFQTGYYPEGLQAEPSHADVSFTFSVSRQQFNSACDSITVYKDHSYILGLNDCRSFAASIASAIDLKLPKKGLKSPALWLSDLVELNPDRW